MGFLQSDQEKLRELEKKLNRLAIDLNRRMLQMDESFSILRDALKRLQKENAELRSDRDFLIEKYKAILKKIPFESEKLADDIRKNLVEPARQSFDEGVALLEKAGTEGLITDEQRIENLKKRYEAPLDELFHLVMKKKRVKARDAAKKFGVHEARIEQWGKLLQNYDLLEVQYSESGVELRKKQ